MDSVGQQSMAQLHGRTPAISSRSARTSGPASAWGAAAPAPRWFGDPQTGRRAFKDIRTVASLPSSCRAIRYGGRYVAPTGISDLSLNSKPNKWTTSRILGPFGETVANERLPLVKARVMSLIESLYAVSRLRLPRADALVQWIDAAGDLVVWQAACWTGWVPARVLRRERTSRCGMGSCCCRRIGTANIWSFLRAGMALLMAAASALPLGATACRS